MRKRVYSVKRRVSRPARSTDSPPIMGRGKVTSRPPPRALDRPRCCDESPLFPGHHRRPSASLFSRARDKTAKIGKTSPREPTPSAAATTARRHEAKRRLLKLVTRFYKANDAKMASTYDPCGDEGVAAAGAFVTATAKQRRLSHTRTRPWHRRAALYSTSHMYTTDGKVEKTLAKCT